MKNLFIGLFVLVSGWDAQAVYQEGWDRPVEQAQLKITHGINGFADLDEAKLTHTVQDGSGITKFTIEYLDPESEKMVSKKLEITHVEKNDCGSTVYSAQLPIDIRESYQEFKGLLAMTKDSGLRNSDPVNGARFNLTLIDHRTRICEDHRAYAWEVSVREGYGWCGTMDSVFEAVGNPEPVYTIMMDPAAIDY